MIYFSDAELDALLLEDIYRGDLTSHCLNLQNIAATMQFTRQNAGVVAGIDIAAALLRKLQLDPQILINEGEIAQAGECILRVSGNAALLHQGWKVTQCVLEWCCGVAQYMQEMCQNATQVNPNAIILCTRKSIPMTRKLATQAILSGGGGIHRQGLSETLLVFTNHRRLLTDPDNFIHIVQHLRHHAPENKITVEADNFAQFLQILPAQPDIIQLDKFSLADVKKALTLVKQQNSPCSLSVAGGVNKDNIADFATLGISLFITSAPYYAPPQDIKVIIEPLCYANTTP